MGDPDAPVHVVEYSNFTCSHCANFFVESETMFIQDYVKTGKVYFTYIPYVSPQDTSGFKAAETAFCAGDQGKFWDMHDVLFSNFNFYVQNNGFSQRSLDLMAENVGLDMDALAACLDAGAYRDTILDAANAGTNAGVSGTPTFLVNGVAVVGNDPQGLIREIELALASTAE
jgi:protein-disulfide isomerase